MLPRSPFVGRTGERDQLAAWLVAAEGSTASTVLLSGDSGVGKSRLLEEFTASATESGALVLSGACMPMVGGAIPYAPLFEALRLFRRRHGDVVVHDIAGPAWSELTALISDAGDAEVPATVPGSQLRVFEAVLGLLDQIGVGRPVVLILEDVHWADSSTVDLIAYLTRAKSTERMMLICSYRSGLEPGHPLRSLLAEPEFTRRIHRMTLAGFSRSEMRTFLAGAGGDPSVDRDKVQRYFELSDGNPFFADLLRVADHPGDQLVSAPMPEPLMAIMSAFVERLGEDALGVVQVAAVTGRSVSDHLLAVVSELDDRILDSALRECLDRLDMSAHAVGRLKPGVALGEARADMDGIAHHLAAAYPTADKDVGITLLPLKEDMVGDVKPLLAVLLGAVGFLLLLACANVASLLLARSMRRTGEFAIRAALGASRARVIRQLLTESVLLAGMGGALGLALAWFGTKAVVGLLPSTLPRVHNVAIDGRVLGFTLAVSLLGGIAFGMAPALTASRNRLQEVLRQSGRGVAGAGHRLQGMLVPVEVAAALVLLVGAGLMLRSLAALWKVNPGYLPDHAITFSLSLPANAKTTAAETEARMRRLDASMEAIPGVEAVSATLGSRPMIHDSELPFWIEGKPKPVNDNDMPQAMLYLVEPGYRKAMGMTLERGRWIREQDDEKAPVVVDIDDAFARKYFANENPVGQHLHFAEFDVDAEVVGVVGHVRQWGPGNDPRAAIEAQFFYPFAQLPAKLIPLVDTVEAVVIRTQGDPAAVMGPVRKAVVEIDPGAVVYAVETMQGVLDDSLEARRMSMVLLAAFAAFAVAMSCVGIYGVTAYLVSERTREIGVRMALGAQRGDVLRLIVGRGARMALAGVVLGVCAALGLTRLMASELYGVSAHDPATFAAVGAGLLLVGVGACVLPARRATRIDPMEALRCE